MNARTLIPIAMLLACDTDVAGQRQAQYDIQSCEDCERTLCEGELTACWEDGYDGGCAAILACRLWGNPLDCSQAPDAEAIALITAADSCSASSCGGWCDSWGYQNCPECVQVLCGGDMGDQPCVNSQCGGYCPTEALPTCGPPSMACVQCLSAVQDESEPACLQVPACVDLAGCVEAGASEEDCALSLGSDADTVYLHQQWQGARSVCAFWDLCE